MEENECILTEKQDEIVNIKIEFNKAYSKLESIEKEEWELLNSKIVDIKSKYEEKEEELWKHFEEQLSKLKQEKKTIISWEKEIFKRKLDQRI